MKNVKMSILEQALTKEYNQDVKVTHDDDIVAEMKDIKDATKEIFVCFHLNTKNQIIKREIVSIGTLNSSIVHPREVFRGAIISNANSIIVAHNHPSGDTEPSKDDVDVTKSLVNAGDILGIKILDHIIIGRTGNSSSLKVMGLM